MKIDARVGLAVLVFCLLGCAQVLKPAPEGVLCTAGMPCAREPMECKPWREGCKYPTFDKAFRSATHNSYWVNFIADAAGSGTQQRLLDQLLHEHVRAFELDLHFEAGHPGEFT